MLLEERWLNAALFLSLDVVESFLPDLWIPVTEWRSFNTQLRKLLAPSLVDIYSERRNEIGYEVVDWYGNTFGRERLLVFNSWIRNVIVLDGPDRPGETLWTPIMHRIAQSEVAGDIPDWIRSLMRRVRLVQRPQKELLQERLDALDELEGSEWDSQLFQIRDSSLDAVLTTISLVGEYNAFVTAWEQHCSVLNQGELHDLWESGKIVARGMDDDLELPFPGMWRIELLDFIRNFEE